MVRQIVTTDKVAAPAGPFSAAVRAGESVYLSGQVAQDPMGLRESECLLRAPSESPYPARTTVAVAALPLGAKVELDLVAR
jgi:enamine deaminase RidA (YjgF/YER057c/UK114 family)